LPGRAAETGRTFGSDLFAPLLDSLPSVPFPALLRLSAGKAVVNVDFGISPIRCFDMDEFSVDGRYGIPN
jgi:hypothetical protein